MKTLVLLSCCPEHSVTDWSPVINALPCICWGIIALVGLFFLLKLVVSPLIANCHEMKVKEVNNKYEDKLAKNKEIKEATLKQKDNDLEVERLKVSLAQMKLKAYDDFYKDTEFHVNIKSDGNKEQLGKKVRLINQKLMGKKKNNRTKSD